MIVLFSPRRLLVCAVIAAHIGAGFIVATQNQPPARWWFCALVGFGLLWFAVERALTALGFIGQSWRLLTFGTRD